MSFENGGNRRKWQVLSPRKLLLTRRETLARVAGALALAAFPRSLGAQPRTARIGAIHPVSGSLADVGLACRLGVQLAVDAVNAGGGIASLEGARLELLVGDSAGAAGPRAEAERLIRAGARVLTGAFHSGHTSAIASVARLQRIPFLVDTAVADGATLAASEPAFVFRNFPSTSTLARRSVQHLVDLFADAQRPIGRVALMHTTDMLGTTQARRFEAAYTLLRPAFEMLEFVAISPRATGVTSEVARLRAGAPDVLLLAIRPSIVGPLFRQLARDPLPVSAIVSLGTPEIADAARAAGLTANVERVMEIAASPNPRSARTQRLADEFLKRSGGRPLDAIGGYAYEAVLIVADAIERAGSTEPDAIAGALRRTNFTDPLMVAAGPVIFDASGENPNVTPAVLQIFGGRPVVVWPRAAAERPYIIQVRGDAR
jgi:branched-chain amino acid transport system substrate-binding protein